MSLFLLDYNFLSILNYDATITIVDGNTHEVVGRTIDFVDSLNLVDATSWLGAVELNLVNETFTTCNVNTQGKQTFLECFFESVALLQSRIPFPAQVVIEFLKVVDFLLIKFFPFVADLIFP